MDKEPAPQGVAQFSARTAEEVMSTQHHSEDVRVVHLSPVPVGESQASPRPESQISYIDQRQPLLRPGPSENHYALPRSRSREDPFESVPAPPAARSRDGRGSLRYQTLPSMAGPPMRPRSTSGIDWIVPVEEKSQKRRTVGERLQPTIENAESEKKKYTLKASWTGYTLNIAIAMQVFFGALTTGLAAAVQNARQAQISTAILGGLSTIVASYLARARGSGEPEFSTRRVKDLEHFLRDCRAFQIDHAHEYAVDGGHLDHRVEELRRKLEEMLGNPTNGNKKGLFSGTLTAQAQSPQPAP